MIAEIGQQMERGEKTWSMKIFEQVMNMDMRNLQVVSEWVDGYRMQLIMVRAQYKVQMEEASA